MSGKTKIIYKEIAPGADEDAEVITEDALEYLSDFSSVPFEAGAIAPNITLEHNEWVLDGTREWIESYPFWSRESSDPQTGEFSVPPKISFAFDNQYSAPGVSLIFDETTGNYCSEVNIKWYQGDNLKSEKTFYPDNYAYYCENPVTAWDKITVEFKKTSLPDRYVRLSWVIFGIYRMFGMNDLRSGKIINESTGLSAEVPISTFNWQLDSHDNVRYMFLFKQPVEVYNKNVLIGVYYIDEHRQLSKSVYDISCYDAIGVLSDSAFEPAIYTSYSARNIVLEIVGADFEVVFEPGLKDTLLTGVITADNKRDALQQVLFAWGVSASTDNRDSIYIFKHPDASAAHKVIDKNHVYLDSEVETSSVVTEVRVTAHTYKPSENGSVEINGQRYDDVTSVYSISNPDVTITDKTNVIKVDSATLVSPDNAREVAQRVYDYYMRRKQANAKIVWREEKLGDAVKVPNGWDEPVVGNIEKMEITLSNTVAADCEIRGIE